jgi:tetratricopeptide (TPR) repeat protein
MSGRWLLAVVLLAALVAAMFRPWSSTQVPAAELLRSAREQFATGIFDEAERLALAAVASDPSLTFSWVIAGESALHRRQYDRALEHFSEIGSDGRFELFPRARYGEALAAYEARRLARCERCLRQALEAQPDWFEARLRLIRLLGVTGRHWEQMPHIMTLLRNRNIQAELLLVLLREESHYGAGDLLDEATQAEPSNPFAWLGMGCLATEFRQIARAGELLQQSRGLLPNHAEIETRWGTWLLENRPEAFVAWHQGTTADLEKHPQMWLTRGRWTERSGETAAAVRCYIEALLLDPDLPGANHGAGRLLVQLGRPKEAEPFLARADRLDQLSEIADRMRSERPRSAEVNRMIELLEQCGRFWEASAWATLASEFQPGARWSASSFQRGAVRLDAGAPRTAPEYQPALAIPVGSFPLPEIGGRSRIAPVEADSRIPRTIQFVDITSRLGLDFTYVSAPLAVSSREQIIDSTGGGVAVLDYDRDGRPDLYFTQGGAYPFLAGTGLPTDRLFRGSAPDETSDATVDTTMVDADFGQGVAAGDVDNDGFADLYVGNLGQNRLWINIGDGTFVESSSMAPPSQWTTSVVIADLDHDGVPDLFDTGYRNGDLPGTGAARPPRARAAPDRIWCGKGDGRFEPLASPLLERPDGYGLAVAVGDFDGDRGLDLLVADEGERTAFLKVRSRKSPQAAAVTINAGLSLPAARGIACDDIGGDGRLDVLLATQGRLPWTLLNGRDPAGALFELATPLDPEPDAMFAGYGAQFLDADLDGRSDVIVTRSEKSHAGLGQSADPRFYWNAGDEQFLGAGATLGDYFATQRTGRGLVRLDWDVDGRPDFAASHLGSPAAVVLNRSEPVGRPLVLALVSTRMARDAIGTSVTITAGAARRSQQLTAGDGFHASNERLLLLALPKSAPDVLVRVVWPGGNSEQYRLPATIRRAVLIEGRDAPAILARDE